jgi:hypothetical protein
MKHLPRRATRGKAAQGKNLAPWAERTHDRDRGRDE